MKKNAKSSKSDDKFPEALNTKNDSAPNGNQNLGESKKKDSTAIEGDVWPVDFAARGNAPIGEGDKQAVKKTGRSKKA